jgi:hypothetical protein
VQQDVAQLRALHPRKAPQSLFPSLPARPWPSDVSQRSQRSHAALALRSSLPLHSHRPQVALRRTPLPAPQERCRCSHQSQCPVPENQATPAAPAQPLRVRCSDGGGVPWRGRRPEPGRVQPQRGIAHETWPAHAQQTARLSDATRPSWVGCAMLLDWPATQTLWVEAARHVQHSTIARLSRVALRTHEALTGDKPDVSDLRVWGCWPYDHGPPGATDRNWATRARAVRGHQPPQACRVLVSSGIVISTQVRFDEGLAHPPSALPPCCLRRPRAGRRPRLPRHRRQLLHYRLRRQYNAAHFFPL